MTRPRAARATIAPRLLGACGAAALAACVGTTFPTRLCTTVHRHEEQGIDYASSGTSTLEITLAGARGQAVRTTQATDVQGTDAHTTDERVVYDVSASWSGEHLVLALDPDGDAPAHAEAVTLVCERWTEAMQSAARFESSAPGATIEWACALPEGRTFALGRAIVEHVPRTGAFVLLGSGAGATIVETVQGQGGRTLSLR